MRKIVLIISLFFHILLLSSCIQNTLPPELPSCEELEAEFIEKVNFITTQRIHSTVRIQTFDPETEITQTLGSGVIYKLFSNHFLILTNHHVIKDYTSNLDLRMLDAQGFYTGGAEIVYEDEDNDLAVIRVRQVVNPNNISRAAPLAENASSIGDYIFNIGAPLGQINAVLIGQVLRYEAIDLFWIDAEIEFLITNHEVFGGLSGSGVFNIEGHIVGIVTGYAETLNETIIIPLEVIQSFIEAFESSEAYR